MFKNDLGFYENLVRSPITTPINQCQFDALVSFAFNVTGPGGQATFTTSNVAESINQGNYDSVPSDLSAWIYAYDAVQNKPVILEGLIRRRQIEGNIFSNCAYSSP